MAVQIIEKRTCDGLKLGAEPGEFVVRHDPPVPGLARVFALDGKKSRAVDLCDPCNGGLTLDELRFVLNEYGRVVEAGKKSPLAPPSTPGQLLSERTRCLWCPGDFTWGAWGGHIRSVHGFKGVKDALGTTCPVCGGEYDGLSVHIRQGHEEFDLATDAFFWARDNGDPYQVWAAVTKTGRNVQAGPATLL